MASIGLIGTAISAVSTVVGMVGKIREGKADAAAAVRQGEMDRVAGQNQQALDYRKAQAAWHEGELAKSRNRALLQGDSDYGKNELALNVAQQYNSDMFRAQGDHSAELGRQSLADARATGRSIRSGAYTTAAGMGLDFLGGTAKNMYDLYGGFGPPKPATTTRPTTFFNNPDMRAG